MSKNTNTTWGNTFGGRGGGTPGFRVDLKQTSRLRKMHYNNGYSQWISNSIGTTHSSTSSKASSRWVTCPLQDTWTITGFEKTSALRCPRGGDYGTNVYEKSSWGENNMGCGGLIKGESTKISCNSIKHFWSKSVLIFLSVLATSYKLLCLPENHTYNNVSTHHGSKTTTHHICWMEGRKGNVGHSSSLQIGCGLGGAAVKGVGWMVYRTTEC